MNADTGSNFQRERNIELRSRGLQWCNPCGRELPQSAFHVSRWGSMGAYCIECVKEKNRERYDVCGRQEQAEKARRRNYGLEPAQYDAMLAEQGGKCKCCGVDLSSLRSRFVQVDHDYATGAVRGIICRRCNLTIAMAQDSIDVLTDCAQYLRRENDMKGT